MRQIKSVGLFAVLMMFSFSFLLNAQQKAKKTNPYKVSGTVIDKSSNKPVQYATVTLLSQPDSAIENGIITDEQGNFSVGAKAPGQYTLRIKFIGYESFYKDVNLHQKDAVVELGEIIIGSSSVNLKEVEVSANDRTVQYKIDRKVVNVGEQYSAVSGNAVDVLKNVPSIQVDIEDNVSLRGNSNFTVLIDGRPSVLEGSEALQQIPAAMIQDIEIITNPSAKFDPEGTAGIINIITKKRTLTGFNGIANGDIGLDDKYGADFLLNYRTEKFNFFVGGDYNDRNYPGTVERRQETYKGGDTISYLNSEGDYMRAYNRYGGRAGIEWFPDEKNTLSINGRYGGRSMEKSSLTQYKEWTEWTDYTEEKRIYTNDDIWKRSGDFYALNTEYTHNFNGNKSQEEHRLDVHLMMFKREGDEKSVNYLTDPEGTITSGQKSTETGPHGGIRYRVNYKQPFSRAFNIETGLQGRIHGANEVNELFDYNLATGKFDIQEQFSHDVSYSRNINGLYGLMKGEYNEIGYQLGLRGEYTYRDIRMTEKDKFIIDRLDFFPTIHMSYNLAEKNQLMASYTRRIRRPRGWYLEPFITWSDAYNVRRGNPDLLPEYIDSYELGHTVDFSKKHSLSTELYYRVSHNEIERIRSIWEENDNSTKDIMLTSYENVGTEYRLGTEIMLSNDFFNWWKSDLIGNFFDYRIKGEINGRAYDRGSFTWSLRWNNILKVGKKTRFQINPSYDSREVEIQDVEAPVFRVDGAIRHTFMENKLNLTLQVRDIFATAKHESEINEPDFYAYRLYRHRAPIIMLNISLRINNYQNDKKGQDGGIDDGGIEGGEGL